MPAHSPSPEREAARAAGRRTYTTGVACRHGHLERYVANGNCCECQRLAGAKITGTASGSTRSKSTQDEMLDRRAAILEIAEEVGPATVRQVYYQATVRGVVEKTEAGYKQVLLDLKYLRENDELDWDTIRDNTRTIQRWQRYSSVEEALQKAARSYRRKLWDESDAYVQIWLEKDALAGVLEDVVYTTDVPLCVSRGYPSLTLLHDAAEELDDHGDRECFVYQVGDYDPSGVDVARDIEEKLREMSSTDFAFKRLAVTEDQIADWNLPSRPTKQSDTRAAGFSAESVELDAIHPDQLRKLVRDAIEQHVDEDALVEIEAEEESERELLKGLAV